MSKKTNSNKKPSKKLHRMPKMRNKVVQIYLQPTNYAHVRVLGQAFKTMSSYIDALVALDKKNGYTKPLIKVLATANAKPKRKAIKTTRTIAKRFKKTVNKGPKLKLVKKPETTETAKPANQALAA